MKLIRLKTSPRIELAITERGQRLIVLQDRWDGLRQAKAAIANGDYEAAVRTGVVCRRVRWIGGKDEIEQIARKDYPETALLQQVGRIGPLIALTFVLTVEDKDRFQKSRDIGCYLGLRPRRCELGPEPTAATNHEGRRLLSADDAGARSTLHHQPART